MSASHNLIVRRGSIIAEVRKKSLNSYQIAEVDQAYQLLLPDLDFHTWRRTIHLYSFIPVHLSLQPRTSYNHTVQQNPIQCASWATYREAVKWLQKHIQTLPQSLWVFTCCIALDNFEQLNESFDTYSGREYYYNIQVIVLYVKSSTPSIPWIGNNLLEDAILGTWPRLQTTSWHLQHKDSLDWRAAGPIRVGFGSHTWRMATVETARRVFLQQTDQVLMQMVQPANGSAVTLFNSELHMMRPS